MSKSNMLLGLARGKVGDLVFYRDGGEQRTRTRVVPKNPRSAAQMAQRVKIANVGGIYRHAAQILRDSFSNRPSNQSGYNAFAAGAIINSPYLTSSMAKAGVCIPQPAMVSRGVLPSLEYQQLAAEEFGGIALSSNNILFEARTLGGYAQAIMDYNPSVHVGDEINFVTMKFKPSEAVDSEVDLYDVVTFIDSFVVDPTDATDIVDTQFQSGTQTMGTKRIPTADEDSVYMQAIVHSRVNADGRLETSTQWFFLSDAAATLYDGYRSDESLQSAIESYKASPTPILR